MVFTEILVVIIARLRSQNTLLYPCLYVDMIWALTQASAHSTTVQMLDLLQVCISVINSKKSSLTPSTKIVTWEWKLTLLWQGLSITGQIPQDPESDIYAKCARLTIAQMCTAPWHPGFVYRNQPMCKVPYQDSPALSPESMESFIYSTCKTGYWFQTKCWTFYSGGQSLRMSVWVFPCAFQSHGSSKWMPSWQDGEYIWTTEQWKVPEPPGKDKSIYPLGLKAVKLALQRFQKYLVDKCVLI